MMSKFRRGLALAVLAGGAWAALHALAPYAAAWLGTAVRAGPPTGTASAAGVLIALGAGAVALGVPRLALYALAGALWGLMPGFALAQTASLIGAGLSYGAGRVLGARHAPLPAALRVPPTDTGVFLARQLPVPGALLSMALGAQRVPWRAYLAGTCAGFVPQGAAAALAGSGWAAHGALPTALRLTVAGLGLLALGLWGRRLADRKLCERVAQPPPAAPRREVAVPPAGPGAPAARADNLPAASP